MRGRGDQIEYECEECGYELTALTVEGAPVRCPECGREFRWPPPLKRAARPAWWRLGLWMCGPAVCIVALMVTATRFEWGIFGIAFGWPLLLVAWVFAVIGGPAITAGDLAARHVLRPGRRRARWVIQLIGVGVNLAITLAGVGLIAAL